MATSPAPHPDPAADDPAVYSGQTGRGPSPFVLFVVATFWLCVIGGIVCFFSALWGGVVLGIAAICLFAAFLTAG